MSLQDSSFDVVVDKGTLDSILCGEASTLNVQKALNEIARVLNSKGRRRVQGARFVRVFTCFHHYMSRHSRFKHEYGWGGTCPSRRSSCLRRVLHVHDIKGAHVVERLLLHTVVVVW